MRPTNVLDAAHLVKKTWDAIASESFKNTFKTAELEAWKLCECRGRLDNIKTFEQKAYISMNKDEYWSNSWLFKMIGMRNLPKLSWKTLRLCWWAVMMAMLVQGNPPTINNVDFDNFDQLYDTVFKIEHQLLCTAVQVEMINSTLSITFKRNLDLEAKKNLSSYSNDFARYVWTSFKKTASVTKYRTCNKYNQLIQTCVHLTIFQNLFWYYVLLPLLMPWLASS